MEAKETTLTNAESLIEELSDEVLADCVGGTGAINSQDKSLGFGATATVDPLYTTPKQANITYDPTGSLRTR